MKKAVFIIPYFGKLPSYFYVWSITAKKNSDFDFWIITDDSTAKSISENIRIIFMNFNEFVKKIQKKFTFSIGLNNVRKLCDFNPTYGYIFEDEIKDYLYWGYCDIDIILGNLNETIPIESLYDKLFVHGHMTLFKNNYEINRLFMKEINFSETYQEILTDTKNRIFDEFSDGLNINLIAQQNNIKLYYDYSIADINPYSFLFKRSLYDYGCANKKSRKTKNEKITKQIFYWKNGTLYRYALDEDDVLLVEKMRYLHFQKRNLKIGDISKCNSFLIVPNMIKPFTGEIDKELLKSFTRNKLIYPQYFRLKLKNIKSKFRR